MLAIIVVLWRIVEVSNFLFIEFEFSKSEITDEFMIENVEWRVKMTVA